MKYKSTLELNSYIDTRAASVQLLSGRVSRTNQGEVAFAFAHNKRYTAGPIGMRWIMHGIQWQNAGSSCRFRRAGISDSKAPGSLAVSAASRICGLTPHRGLVVTASGESARRSQTVDALLNILTESDGGVIAYARKIFSGERAVTVAANEVWFYSLYVRAASLSVFTLYTFKLRKTDNSLWSMVLYRAGAIKSGKAGGVYLVGQSRGVRLESLIIYCCCVVFLSKDVWLQNKPKWVSAQIVLFAIVVNSWRLVSWIRQ